jgi:hypothetical protein
MAIVNIDPEFKDLIQAPNEKELAALELSLRTEGCKDPLRLWGNILIDGHNRYEICERLRIPYGSVTIDLEDREEAKLWIMRNQLARRNVTDLYRSVLIQRIADAEAEKSRNAQLAEARAAKVAGDNTVALEIEGDRKKQKKRTYKKVAEENGTTAYALEQAKKLNDAAASDDPVRAAKGKAALAKVRDGKTKSMAAAVREVTPVKSTPGKRRKPTVAKCRKSVMAGIIMLDGICAAFESLDYKTTTGFSPDEIDQIVRTVQRLPEVARGLADIVKAARRKPVQIEVALDATVQ